MTPRRTVFFFTGALALPFAAGLTFLKLICIFVPFGKTKSLMETGRSPLFGSIVKLFGWTGALALPAGLNAGFLTLAPRPLRVTFAPYSTSTGERFVTGSKTRARTFFFVALAARFWISFWDSFGPPMPLRAFIFCWRFILLAA